MKRTKIVCTIGPSSKSPRILDQLIASGMNVARLNFSHGSAADHTRIVNAIRRASKKRKTPVALLQDLQGPKIRVGDLPKDGIVLKAGEDVVFSATNGKGKIPVQYARLAKDVEVGHRILLDDGLLEVKVERITGRDVHCRVVTGGRLTSHKGMNFPQSRLSVPGLTAKDKVDVALGVKLGVDYIALSFVRTAQDIATLRAVIAAEERKQKKHGATPIMIISKIEKHEALTNFPAILEATDAVMVARGDLGVETPAEDVPLHQKKIIALALEAGKPVIVATQMLDSMIRNPRPTRAEVSDVANAIIDHTDAVMLSGETASGAYPVEAVKIMAKTAEETERSFYDDLRIPVEDVKPAEPRMAFSQSAAVLARITPADAILSVSVSGRMGRRLSRFRPEIPLLVGTFDPRVERQLALSWGVVPVLLKMTRDPNVAKKQLLKEAGKRKLLKRGSDFLCVMGSVERDRKGPKRISLELFRG